MTERIHHRIGTFKGDEDAMQWMTLAIAEIGLRASIRRTTASVDPTSNLRLSSASTSPQSKSLLITKPSSTPVLDCAVMVQSLNLPVAVVIGFSAPHARSEGALVELCRGEESHDQRREEQGSHCHGSPRAPAFSHLTTEPGRTG